MYVASATTASLYMQEKWVCLADIQHVTAVSLALNKLGIKTYDMSEAMRDSVNGSLKKWREGAEADYFNGLGKKLQKKQDFDDLLYRYQVGLSHATAYTTYGWRGNYVSGRHESSEADDWHRQSPACPPSSSPTN